MKLEFDEESHTYAVDGKPIPGVTSILKAVGLSKDFSGVDTFYRDRGIAVAYAIELFLKGTLDEKSLDPVLVPYFDGFRRYWDVNAAKPIAIEKANWHEKLWFAGKIDLVTDKKIIDWKCSKSHDPVAELQGEAYKLLWGEMPFEVVQLPGDGTFRIFSYGDTVTYWPSIMKAYEWVKKAHPRARGGVR